MQKKPMDHLNPHLDLTSSLLASASASASGLLRFSGPKPGLPVPPGLPAPLAMEPGRILQHDGMDDQPCSYQYDSMNMYPVIKKSMSMFFIRQM